MASYKGSRIVPVRLPPEILEQLDTTIERVNATRRAEPFDRSAFIRAAIADKINHYNRSRRKPTNQTEGA